MRLPKFLKKLFSKQRIALFLVFSFLFLSIFSKPLLAFSTKGSSYQSQFEDAVFGTDEMNLQSFVFETLKATVGSVMVTIICFSCKDRNLFKGLLGFTGTAIAGIYANPPASSIQYLAYLENKLGVVRPAYAQEGTTGWDMMKNVMPLWSAFRNLAYALFVIIFIFIGFAIMFRLKISPQAVVTIETALPKIIIALLLVTFSYAIVGLLIDLMYVLFALVTFVFLDPNSGVFIQQFGPMVQGIGMFSNFTSKLSSSPITQTYILNGIFLFLTALVALIFALINGPIGIIVGFFGVIVSIIALLRCFLALLKAWVNIIINLVFAPFIIVMGALPGSSSIGSWFKNLLANIAVLPIIYTMFLLCSFFILSGIERLFSDPGNVFLTLTTNWFAGIPLAIATFTLSSTDYWNYISALFMPIIGLMILWMAPKASDMVKSFMMGKPFEYGTAIGEAMGPVVAGGQMFAQARYAGLEAKKAEAEQLHETLGKKDTLERTLYQVMNVRGMIKKP